jgi:hypothetical protein
VSSNITHRYSTEGQAMLVVHDRPWSDENRTVTLLGVTLTEEESCWFLSDRRNPAVSTALQVRVFDRSRADWYKSSPDWWDRNLDRPGRGGHIPNDLVISGVVGHPVVPDDVKEATRNLAAWRYWRAKAGASGFVITPTGDEIPLANLPAGYADFVNRWRIRTAVVAV